MIVFFILSFFLSIFFLHTRLLVSRVTIFHFLFMKSSKNYSQKFLQRMLYLAKSTFTSFSIARISYFKNSFLPFSYQCCVRCVCVCVVCWCGQYFKLTRIDCLVDTFLCGFYSFSFVLFFSSFQPRVFCINATAFKLMKEHKKWDNKWKSEQNNANSGSSNSNNSINKNTVHSIPFELKCT